MDIEKIKNITVTTAIIIGGLWTAYTFRAEFSSATARAKLEKLKIECQRTPSITINLNVKKICEVSEDGQLIEVIAQVGNKGNLPVKLDLSEPTFALIQVQWRDDKIVRIGSAQKARVISSERNIKSWEINPNEIEKIPVIFNIKNNGVYLIEFVAPQSKDTGTGRWGTVIYYSFKD